MPIMAPDGLSIGAAMFSQQMRNEGHRITSTTGGVHSGAAHGQGLAVDFVPADIPGEAKRLRARLAQMGIDAKVIDASTRDSASWTGPHVHMEFANPAAAAKFAEMSAVHGGGGRGGSSVDNSREVTIHSMTVNAPAATAAGIAQGIRPAINADLNKIVVNANGGQQN